MIESVLCNEHGISIDYIMLKPFEVLCWDEKEYLLQEQL